MLAAPAKRLTVGRVTAAGMMSECRTCLGGSAHYSLLARLGEGAAPESAGTWRALDVVTALCGGAVQIKENDGLPTKICTDCFETVKGAYCFKKKCEKSDKILQQRVLNAVDNVTMISLINNTHPHFNYEVIKEELCADTYDKLNNKQNNSTDTADNEARKIKEELDDIKNDSLTNPDMILFNESTSEIKDEIQTEFASCSGNSNSDICVVKSEVLRNCIILLNEDNADTMHNPLENCEDNTRENKFKLKIKKKLSGVKKKDKHSKLSKLKITPDKKCPHCDYTTNISSHLRLHLHTHTGEKPLACDQCNFRCIKACSLQSHKLIHTKEKPYKCFYCDFKCSNSSNLKRHIKRHTNEKPYSCNVCSYSCTQLFNLREHERIHTGEKPFLCDQCEYNCSTRSCLQAHKRNKHSVEKRFHCDECNFSAKTNSALTSHKKKHYGIKDFSCDLCPYRSIQLVSLGNHIKMVHTGERPFACDQCSYRAANASYLKIHKQSHLTIRLFSCDECPYSCNTKFKLKSHKMTHTGEKPYRCKDCDFKCGTSSSLKRHQRRHHGSKCK